MEAALPEVAAASLTDRTRLRIAAPPSPPPPLSPAVRTPYGAPAACCRANGTGRDGSRGGQSGLCTDVAAGQGLLRVLSVGESTSAKVASWLPMERSSKEMVCRLLRQAGTHSRHSRRQQHVRRGMQARKG